MKLRTSFCKPVALKKDILRFAPMWVLYLVGVIMVLLSLGGYYEYDRFAKNMLPGLISAFAVVNILYAAGVAVLLFGDLYNTKMCYSLHAMPIRREGWLATHLISGMLYSMVPNLVVALYLMIQLEAYWYLALYWYLAITLQFMFFYGLATLSAMLTGNRFAMLAVYAGFNFVSMLIYATIYWIYLPMLEGVAVQIAPFRLFSPVVELFDHDYFSFHSTQVLVNSQYMEYNTFYVYDGLADGWGYTAILAVVGLAAMGISVWLYRIRQLECAGDFIAFPRLKGITCVVITLCVSLCCALVGSAFGGNYVAWLIVGLVVGFFGSLMLLERRLKVFRKKTFLAFGILLVAVVLSLFATEYDWFGIESWTPKASKVQSITVSNHMGDGYSYYKPYYDNRIEATVTDPTQIQELIDAHEDILSRMHESATSKHRVVLTYKMKSGATVVRNYYAPANGENYRIVRKYLYNAKNTLGFADWQDVVDNISYFSLDGMDVPQDLYDEAMAALQADCVNGAVGLPQWDKTEHYLDYGFYNAEDQYVYRSLVFGGDAVNLVKLLKNPEMAMGFTDVQTAMLNQFEMHCNGEILELYMAKELLYAMTKDVAAGALMPFTYDGEVDICYSFHAGEQYIIRDFSINKYCTNTMALLQEYDLIQK